LELESFPIAQGSQEDDDSFAANLPGEHSSQAWFQRTVLEMKPGLQREHPVLPSWTVYFPAVHSSHSCFSVVATYQPLGQAVQFSQPVDSANLPAAHLMHTAISGALPVDQPAGHSTQATSPNLF
jgi:hypothetical protein